MTLRRRVAAACAVAVAAALGCIQLVSMALYGDLAQPPALPAIIAPQLGIALGAPLAGPHVPAFLRLAYAGALLHRGEGAAAAAIVAGLPPTYAADLRGQLAEARGDSKAALAAYAAAGDFLRAQRLIDARAASGSPGDAVHLERALVAALGGGGQAAVRARAWWRLGQLLQVQAVAQPATGAGLARSSLAAYDEALALAPNEETYLLAAGRQALSIGDRSRAAGYYERALVAVPDSADARAGLAAARP